MNPLQAEALLVRYQGILGYLETTDEQGRWALLAEVIDPNPYALKASLTVAAERGISKLAVTMAAGYHNDLAHARAWLRRNYPNRFRAAEAMPAAVA
jgi:hypothetical protein